MIALAIALVGCVLIAAVWDTGRRALAAQVRSAELRVEAMRRADVEALRAELARVREAGEKTASDLAALDSSLAFGRKGR